MSVSSLFDTALQAVMRDFHHHEPALRYLPSGVKCSVAGVMAKRGLMNERNMSLVSVTIDSGVSTTIYGVMCPLPHCSPRGRMTGLYGGLTGEAAPIVGNLITPEDTQNMAMLFVYCICVTSPMIFHPL